MKLYAVHQSNGLYGSDRVFLETVSLLRSLYPDADITIHLPEEGELAEAFESRGLAVKLGELFVLRRINLRKNGIVSELFSLIRTIPKAYKRIVASDITYLSTTVLTAHILAASICRKRVILHIHEAPSGVIRYILMLCVWLSRSHLLYVSNVAKKSIKPAFYQTSHLIHNAVFQRDIALPVTLPPSDTLNLLLVGRLNHQKGHSIVMKAIAAMNHQQRSKVQLHIVGEVYGDQHHIKNEMVQEIYNLGLETHVTFHPFTNDLTHHYQWCHAVLLPSLISESFGLVCIEAMAHKRVVIASNLGGPQEIISHQHDGILLEAGHVEKWRDTLIELSQRPEQLELIAEQGYQSYIQRYTASRYKERFCEIWESVI